MKERPILFSGPMVRAILEGRKTQTRRILSARDLAEMQPDADTDEPAVVQSLRFSPGDRLWVKETFTRIRGNGIRLWYRADGEPLDRDGNVMPTTPGEPRWASPLFMRRIDSRLTLEVTGVRVERLQDITEEDARAEGVEPFDTGNAGDDRFSAREQFAALWDTINGKRAPWASNPWVWVVAFTRLQPCIQCGRGNLKGRLICQDCHNDNMEAGD